MFYLLTCIYYLYSNTRKCISLKLNLFSLISKYFHFPLLVFCLQCSTLIFILILFLSEGQAGDAWKVANKAMLFQTRENSDKQNWFKLLNFTHQLMNFYI